MLRKMRNSRENWRLRLETQGKNSKLKEKTQFFGIFRILRCEKGGQKKPDLYVRVMFIAQ